MVSAGPVSEADFRTEVVLRDGSVVELRSIRPDDDDRLIALAGRCSDRTLYYRFFTPPPLPFDRERLEFLTNVDSDRRVALVAHLGRGEGEKVVAVGRWDVLEDDPTSAEVAFLVEDEYQGTGLGTALLRHLAALAPRHGIRTFEADVLGDNRAMLTVFGRSGYRVTHELDSGVYHLVFPVRPTPESLEAAAAHERDALAASLSGFLEPARVAIVGASSDDRSLGASLLRNLVNGGFAGAVYPVNERGESVVGIPAYRRVEDLPEDVDLAVLAVAAEDVASAVESCGAHGMRAALVVSPGVDAMLQQEMLARGRKYGMRILGPGSTGVLNTDPRISLRLITGDVDVPPGLIGIAAQSGALGLGVLDYLRSLNLGVSQFVSLGDRADVSSNDILGYWAGHEATRVILLYLERFGSPRRFVRLARRIARDKPIAAVAVGDAAAHPAARALFAQAGVIRTPTLEELLDVAAILATQPVPRGPRVAVVSNSGGAVRLASQALAQSGLEVAELCGDTVARLARLDVEVGPDADRVELAPSPEEEGRYGAVLDVIAADPGVDSVLTVYTPLHKEGTDRIARAIVSASWKAPEITFLVNFLSTRGVPNLLRRGRVAVPSYLFPESAVRALAHAVGYGAWLAQPEAEPERPEGMDGDRVREVLSSAEEGMLGPRPARELMAAMGIDLENRPHGIPFVVHLEVDEVFGPVIGLGAGVGAASIGENCYRITPLTGVDAARLVRAALTERLDSAAEEVDPASLDEAALCDLLVRIGVLAVEQEQVAEVELGPVLVGAPGEGLRVGGVRVRKEEPAVVEVDPAGGVA